MDSFFFQDRQHINVNQINGITSDVARAEAISRLDLIPCGEVVVTGLQVSPTSPASFGVDISEGVAYNSSGVRIVYPELQSIFATPPSFSEELITFATPITATPATVPATLSWQDNTEIVGASTPTTNTIYYRVDIVYVLPGNAADDSVLLDFLGSTGSINQQQVNERLLDLAEFGVSIGEQTSITLAGAPIPSIPENAVPLAQINLSPSQATITSGSIKDIRFLYNILAPKLFIQQLASGSSNYTITHNLNSFNIIVNVRESETLATPAMLFPSSISFLNSNQIQVSFSSPLAENAVCYLLKIDR